ncbi:GTPase family protein [Devriesea agamarum]|uniref:GTPase family protein n=1 Tax=Devriesea agamarum TaxID=472569 RepID=UPI00071C7A6E|nr:GTPase [Devriesea agamarum]
MIGRKNQPKQDIDGGLGGEHRLAARIEALEDVCECAEGRIDNALIERARQVVGSARARRLLSAEHTVVGLFGATGSGKSTVMNALAGRDIARTHVRRPTTSRPLAAIWGSEGSEELLDWLGVTDRHVMGEDRHLVLLDLPDFDSVADEHRRVAEHFAEVVDVLVWVLDPQKYADAVLHRDFVAPHAGHGAVTLVVLNQVDRLLPEDRKDVLRSLREVLAADGLSRVPVVAASARTGEGIDELWARIDDVARRRDAAGRRILADLQRVGTELVGSVGDVDVPGPSSSDVDALTSDLASAVRVPQIAQAAAGSYRKRAHHATGWPFVRWISRFRPDPLRRLGLAGRSEPADLRRTSLPAAGAAQRAYVDGGLRRLAETSMHGVPEGWCPVVRQAVRRHDDALPDALDQAVARTDLGAQRGSWWWPVLGVLQWLALAVLVVGLGWLSLLAVLAYAQLPLPSPPMVDGLGIPIPLPTVLVVLGLALGVLVALGGGACAALASRWRSRQVRERLESAVADVADELVLAPLDEELDRLRGARHALRAATRP